jgi:hypothetical protein
MKLMLNSLRGNIAAVQALAERISHPKDGASAQPPEAERAPDSAVERPEAAGKPRSTCSVPISPICTPPSVPELEPLGVTAASFPEEVPVSIAGWGWSRLQQLPSLECRACWFEPTWKRWRDSHFLVQDRLRASDVLHRDWDWTAWL